LGGNQWAPSSHQGWWGHEDGAAGQPRASSPPLSSPVWYLKGPEEQVKFPGLDVQRQPADEERPHLGKKKGGSWGPSLITSLGIPVPPAARRDNASPRGTSWVAKSLNPTFGVCSIFGRGIPILQVTVEQAAKTPWKGDQDPSSAHRVLSGLRRLPASQRLPTPVWQTGFLLASRQSPYSADNAYCLCLITAAH